MLPKRVLWRLAFPVHVEMRIGEPSRLWTSAREAPFRFVIVYDPAGETALGRRVRNPVFKSSKGLKPWLLV